MPHTSYFIDCGGHQGETIKAFRQKYDPEEKVHCISFEPFPDFWESYKNFSNFSLEKAAVWTRDCQKPIYFARKGTGEGTSLFPHKVTGNLSSEGLLIDCIDFAAYLRRLNAKPIVKLNVEGAEYPLIQHLASTGAMKHIGLLIVSWHYQKLNLSHSLHDETLARITCPYRENGKGYADFGDLSCYSRFIQPL